MAGRQATYTEEVSDKRILKLAQEAGVILQPADWAGLDRRSEASVVRALAVIKTGRRATMSPYLEGVRDRATGHMNEVVGLHPNLTGNKTGRRR